MELGRQQRSDEPTATAVGHRREAPASAPDELQDAAPALDDTSLYLNRELSWLDFNDRVLQLAEDPRLPLLERVKFCAIYTTNLDEFYQVRVAGLRDQIEAGVETPGASRLRLSHSVAICRPTSSQSPRSSAVRSATAVSLMRSKQSKMKASPSM